MLFHIPFPVSVLFFCGVSDCLLSIFVYLLFVIRCSHYDTRLITFLVVNLKFMLELLKKIISNLLDLLLKLGLWFIYDVVQYFTALQK